MSDKPELTAEMVRELLDYDPETGVLTWKSRAGEDVGTKFFNTRYAGRQAGNVDKGHGYRRITLYHRQHLAHRLIWLLMSEKNPDGEIDHVNHQRDDNRFKNLREVTRLGNFRNQTKYRSNTSGVTGVLWHKQHRKWYAQVGIDGRNKFIGLFDNLPDAVSARKQAEKQLGFHGNHGR